jgi:hypothetical protein
MKDIIVALFFCALNFELMHAQAENTDSLFRSERPVGVKLGLEGVGIDVVVGGRVGVGASSFIFYNTAKARLFLLDNNVTPFVGAGIGRSGGPGGNEKDWTVLIAGWEHAYKHLFFQFIVQYAVLKSPSYASPPFPFSLEIGWRF